MLLHSLTALQVHPDHGPDGKRMGLWFLFASVDLSIDLLVMVLLRGHPSTDLLEIRIGPA